MRGRLASILAAALLLLLAVLLIGWVRSYVPSQHWALFSHRGYVVLLTADKRWNFTDPASDQFNGVEQMLMNLRGVGSERSVMGIRSMHGVLDAPNTFWVVSVPYAYLVIPVAAAALLSVRAARTARRREIERRCPDCGYDLRASPQRCPECGRDNPFAPAAPAPAHSTTSPVSTPTTPG